MKNFIWGTAILVGVLCVGYYFHRKVKSCLMDSSKNVLDVLCLKDVFDWIDTIMQNREKMEGVKYEVNILPNIDSQKFLKTKDKSVYVAILQEIQNGEKHVTETKVFYAKTVDIDLDSLNNNNIVVIPIE